MKKLLFTAIAVLSITISQAQNNAVKVNPIGIAFGVANAGYEFSVNDKQTVTIAGLYYDRSSISGFGAGAEYRFYFSDTALKGWHAGPSIGYFSLEDEFDNSGSVFNVGGEVGHQWIFGEHFALDVFAGVAVAASKADNLNVNNTTIGLGVSLGYAW